MERKEVAGRICGHSSGTLRYPVISFHRSKSDRSESIVRSFPQDSQLVPQKSQFVPHILYLFYKRVNVIRAIGT